MDSFPLTSMVKEIQNTYYKCSNPFETALKNSSPFVAVTVLLRFLCRRLAKRTAWQVRQVSTRISSGNYSAGNILPMNLGHLCWGAISPNQPGDINPLRPSSCRWCHVTEISTEARTRRRGNFPFSSNLLSAIMSPVPLPSSFFSPPSVVIVFTLFFEISGFPSPALVLISSIPLIF